MNKIIHIECWALTCCIGNTQHPLSVATISSLHCLFLWWERCSKPISQMSGPLYKGAWLRQRGCLHLLLCWSLPTSNGCANLFVFLKLPSLGGRRDPGVSCSQVWRLQLQGCDPGLFGQASWKDTKHTVVLSSSFTLSQFALCPRDLEMPFWSFYKGGLVLFLCIWW